LWLTAGPHLLTLRDLDRRGAFAYSAAITATVVLVPLSASHGGIASWRVLVVAATSGLAALALLVLVNLWPAARSLAAWSFQVRARGT